jgi:hypothetical protein
MKTCTFNLKNFNKNAFYDGGKPGVQVQTRAFMNCYKLKLDKGMGAQESWESCLSEYNKGERGEWSLNYS